MSWNALTLAHQNPLKPLAADAFFVGPSRGTCLRVSCPELWNIWVVLASVIYVYAEKRRD